MRPTPRRSTSSISRTDITTQALPTSRRRYYTSCTNLTTSDRAKTCRALLHGTTWQQRDEVSYVVPSSTTQDHVAATGRGVLSLPTSSSDLEDLAQRSYSPGSQFSHTEGRHSLSLPAGRGFLSLPTSSRVQKILLLHSRLPTQQRYGVFP